MSRPEARYERASQLHGLKCEFCVQGRPACRRETQTVEKETLLERSLLGDTLSRAIAGNRAQDGAGWRDVGCRCACKAGCACTGVVEYQASNHFLCIMVGSFLTPTAPQASMVRGKIITPKISPLQTLRVCVRRCRASIAQASNPWSPPFT
jgi:hypothetical protein